MFALSTIALSTPSLGMERPFQCLDNDKFATISAVNSAIRKWHTVLAIILHEIQIWNLANTGNTIFAI